MFDGKSAWKWDLYFFFFADGDVFQNAQKANVFKIRWPTWQITQYDTMYSDYLTVTSCVQLPTDVKGARRSP